MEDPHKADGGAKVSTKKFWQTLVRADRSPMNARQFLFTFSCGHEQWETRRRKPKEGARMFCQACAAVARPVGYVVGLKTPSGRELRATGEPRSALAMLEAPARKWVRVWETELGAAEWISGRLIYLHSRYAPSLVEALKFRVIPIVKK